MGFSLDTTARGGGSLLQRPLLLLMLAALPFFVMYLDTPSLNDGEAMYAEIAREMRASGDWITPHLNGNRHFDKPPLIFWLIAGTQMLLGETETSARLWPALAAWGTIGVVGALGSTLYDRQAGFLGALVYATSLGPYIFGRMVMSDPILIFWITLAILGYSRSYLQEGNDGRRPWFWAMYGALGLAVLTKSILGFGLPAAIIGLHVLLSGRLREFFSRSLLMGSAVAAAIALPWHVAVARANSDFLGYYVIREHLHRFTGRRFPPDEFLPLPLFLLLTVLWTFPWITLLPQAVGRSMGRLGFHGWKPFPAPGDFLRGTRFQSDADLLLILWVTVVMGLFSASHSRLEYYALPCMPAIALLVGKLWSDVLSGNPDVPLPLKAGSSPQQQDKAFSRSGEQMSPSQGSLTSALAVMAVLMGIAAAAALVLLGPAKMSISQVITNAWPTGGWTGSAEQMATLERIRVPAMASFAGAAAFSAGAWFAARRRIYTVACGLPAIMMVPFFLLVHWGFLAVEPFQSTRPIAEIVRTHAGPDDMVVFPEPHEYMWVGGITFYAGRSVHILKDPRFDGLESRRREPPDRFLDESEFLKLWGSSQRVLVVTEAEGKLQGLLTRLGDVKVLGKTGGRVVLGNR
ncbi:glycosyltransferase family 39 protein [Desulforhabdus sp. TSK]|uniref:ArnT family glycosyltransferase n=1 Tax=Desulforhabdus sp. TSK TaxID=2925014 RepID=UPI001FC87988|nr:glycosyltransferase family 39 protein [Desulforhabdus sp. TSK]GKT06839.1 hypothetical protein DSTSK_01440 [Desulforhabdus sp. TSK]